jgi:hypothetical protein
MRGKGHAIYCQVNEASQGETWTVPRLEMVQLRHLSWLASVTLEHDWLGSGSNQVHPVSSKISETVQIDKKIDPQLHSDYDAGQASQHLSNFYP